MSSSSPHPDRRLLERWRSRSLTAPEILAVTRHLATCPACQREVAPSLSAETLARGLDRLLAEERETPAHLTPEQLAGWVDRALDPVAAEVVAAHLEGCPSCRDEATELAAFASTAVPIRRATRWRAWAALGGSLAAAALVAWLALRPTTPLPPVGSSTSKEPPPSESLAVLPAAILHDGPLLVDAGGAIHGVEDRWRAPLAEVLRAPELPLPPATVGLARGTGQQRGERGPTPAVRLREPLSRVVLVDRPTFAWQGPAGWAYRIEVYDAQFAQVTTSGAVRALAWTPASPLPRGELLIWRLTATHGGEESSYPSAPELPATFRIATAEAAAEVRAARATGSHLIVGLTLWRAGLLDEGATELALLARANPTSPLARELAAAGEQGAGMLRTGIRPRD